MKMITFDGVELKNVAVFTTAPEIHSTVTLLASGSKHIQSQTSTGFSRTYYCTTDDYSDISDLLAKVGVSGDLVEDGTTYHYCRIVKWLTLAEIGDEYEYALRIEQGVA